MSHNRFPLLFVILLAAQIMVPNLAYAEDLVPPKGDALRIGMLLPLTGPGASIGEDLRSGALLCGGSILEMVFEDSQSSPSAGVSAFSKLVYGDKVNFTVVAFSPIASAVIPLAARRSVPLLLTVVSSTAVARTGGENVVRFFSSGEQEAPIMANVAARYLNLRRVGVLFIEDDYGLSYRDAFDKSFTLLGGTVPRSESFRRDAGDFRAELLRLKGSSVQAIYFVGYDSHDVNILRQADELQLGVQLLGNWTLSHPTVMQLDPKLREGVYFTTAEFYFSTRPEVLRFKREYQERFGRAASGYAGLGCDTAMLLSLVPEKTGRGALTFLKGLETTSGIMGKLKADSAGDITMELYPVVFRSGEVIRIAE
jgi:branched-chain amino acid transport system substrate-binding protein